MLPSWTWTLAAIDDHRPMTSRAAVPFLPHFPETVPLREPTSRRWVRWALIFGAWTSYGLSQGLLLKVTLTGMRWWWAVEICTGVAYSGLCSRPRSSGSSDASRKRTRKARRAGRARGDSTRGRAARHDRAPATRVDILTARRRRSPPELRLLADVHVLTYAMVVAAAWALGPTGIIAIAPCGRTCSRCSSLARSSSSSGFSSSRTSSSTASTRSRACARSARRRRTDAWQLHTLLRLSLERADRRGNAGRGAREPRPVLRHPARPLQ